MSEKLCESESQMQRRFRPVRDRGVSAIYSVLTTGDVTSTDDVTQDFKISRFRLNSWGVRASQNRFYIRETSK